MAEDVIDGMAKRLQVETGQSLEDARAAVIRSLGVDYRFLLERGWKLERDSGANLGTAWIDPKDGRRVAEMAVAIQRERDRESPSLF